MKLIAAVTQDYGVGLHNDLLFKFKCDLAWFKQQTLHQTCIMGYNTFMSLPVTKSGEVLPGRKKVVLCRPDQVYECVVRGAQEVATEVTKNFINKHKNAFVIGGPYCWGSLAPYIDTLYLTHIAAKTPADAYFPIKAFELNKNNWLAQQINTEIENNVELEFIKYTRKRD